MGEARAEDAVGVSDESEREEGARNDVAYGTIRTRRVGGVDVVFC